MIPPQYYITLSLKNLGFDTFQTNLLTIPYYVGHSKLLSFFLFFFQVQASFQTPDSKTNGRVQVITMLGVTYIAEIWGNLTFSAMIGQLWALPLLAYMAVTNLGAVNKWVVWTVTTLLLSYPNGTSTQSTSSLELE